MSTQQNITVKSLVIGDVSKRSLGLDAVNNTSDLDKPISNLTQAAIDLKADQATTYTKVEVDGAISSLIADAPGALDTLNELAAALGDDANFATTITDSIGVNATAISDETTRATAAEGVNAIAIGVNATAIAINTAKVGITPAQASDITANNAKVGITPTQASDIVTNNAKVGITPTQAADIVTNNAKVGITPTQASDISTALQPTDPTLDSVTTNGATTKNNIKVGTIATLSPTAAANDNSATGLQSASIGGRRNTASGTRATTFGGRENAVSGQDSTSVGGNNQKVIGIESEGVGSTNLKLFSKYTSAVGVANSTIGTLNGVDPNPETLYENDSVAKHSIILGGENIEIQHAQHSATVGGDANTVETGHHRSVILGGTGITTDAADTVFVPNLKINNLFKMPTGAADGYVLTSDASGVGTWEANEKVGNDTTGEAAGSDSVLNMVSLTQAQYDTALADFPATIKDTTLYIIKP